LFSPPNKTCGFLVNSASSFRVDFGKAISSNKSAESCYGALNYPLPKIEFEGKRESG